MDAIQRSLAMTEEYAHLHPELWDEDESIFRIKDAGDHFVDVLPLLVTASITLTSKYDGCPTDQWCYTTVEAAVTAAQAWSADPGTEPEGWHRHPRSGRRRPNGDASKEVVYS